MRCVSCQSDNPPENRFCEQCGACLEARCPQCGTAIRPGARFCGACGRRLGGPDAAAPGATSVPGSPHTPALRPIAYTPRHLAERILAEQQALEARGAPDGERKTITALFADIKGSMALIEDLDPEEARQIIDPALTLMMEAVHRYEGYVAQSLGDGIFALFGAPIAHEDHAHRALYAALRMQEASKQYAEQLRQERGINVLLRVGLNTGEVVVRSIRTDDLHTDYVPIGYSISLAARMESLAAPGSIVISEHTYRLTEGYFQFKPLGVAQVKGVSAPVSIYEVLGVGPLRTRLQVAARRGLVRFVGRQGELAQMQQALELATAGRGQIVAVVGELGVGKSRLCYELKLRVPQGWLVLETFAVSYGKAYPYLPLIELVKHYFQLTPQDDERRRREQVTGKVLTLDRSLEDTLPYLFALLGDGEALASLAQMDPQVKRQRTFEAVTRLLLRESLHQPLLALVEDLHWLDSETEAWLHFLSERVATASMVLLVNYRSEYPPAWGSKSYSTHLRLAPLGPEEAQELLTALLGDDADLQPLKQFILAKTEGNPFFMEEIVQALVEQGVLVRAPEGGAIGRSSLRLTKPVTELHLPPTVQGVLAARIDRLPAEEKTLLQTLAVLGTEFSLSLLREVLDQPEEELQRLLSHLQATEFIYEQPAFPEPEYTFKHVLTQEVAYNSLLLERRRALHERAAQALERLFPDRLEERYHELAHHYSRSGNTTKAVQYLGLAGKQAVQRSAYAEAIGHLSMAVALLKTLPDTPERAQQELTLHITLGPALVASRGYSAAEVEQAYIRARQLCQQLGETAQLFPVLGGLWQFYAGRAALQTARELAEQFLSLAHKVQDPAPLVGAHDVLGQTLYLLGEFAPARVHLEQAITRYDPQQHRALALLLGGEDPGVACRGYAAWTLWYLGYPDQALQRVRQALTLAQELASPFNLAWALFAVAWLHHLRRERQAAQEQAEAVIALATEQGFPYWQALGTLLRGWALAVQGQGEEGIAQMRRGLAAYRATGAELLRSCWLARLAKACGDVGQTDAGRSMLAEALAVVDSTGERLWEAEVYRFTGELLLQQAVPDEAQAETWLQQALAVARRQQAKSWELRAVLSLSRLWQRQGKRDAACELLAPIYGWFTEGFDTPDLQDARVLLDMLS